MIRPLVAAIGIVGLTLVLGARTGPTLSPVNAAAPGDPVLMAADPVRAAAHPGAPVTAADLTPEELTAVVQKYCVVCHNDQMLTGNLSLQTFDVAAAPERWEDAEKMITKLRVQMMPPPGMPRPGPDTLLALVETIEQVIDEAAAENPRPGHRSFARLPRAEYERSIKELLGLDVNSSEWLPLDQYLANFDNMAAAHTLSPAVLQSYLKAANEVARMAVGQADVASRSWTYKVPHQQSQHPWEHVDGAPVGTRGGTVVDHIFLADGWYVFEAGLGLGDQAYDELDISIDGERVALLQLEILDVDGNHAPRWFQRTEPIFVPAGQHRVAAAFISKTDGTYDDLMQPFGLSRNGTASGRGLGTILLTHLRELSVHGPENATGVSETVSRQRIFSCRPTSPEQAVPCAREILTRLATEAYRRRLNERDVEGLLAFYERGAAEGGFELGIRSALEAILASPYFVFRIEEQAEDARPGEPYRLRDVDLASRLSFFLWGLPPDGELIDLAAEGELTEGDNLEAQTRRMLADPRSGALATRFASQWLRLQDLDKLIPDDHWYPGFTAQIRDDFRRETELFFSDLLRQDGNVLELFSADWTYVNDRLAKHYGIPGVAGDDFRRVSYPEGMQRRGLLGQGSVLGLTSVGTRTSPVLRGKWVMEVILGSPPPPPPPGVPDLEETEGSTEEGRILTTRERMEIHRANPTCNACHRFMDPIGLALDNFDVTGEWRTRENGMPLDTRGELYDGTPVSSPTDLTEALMERAIPVVRNFTTNLMAYALGRRIEYYDGPAIREITREGAKNEYRMSSFILGVIKSPGFQTTTIEAVTTAAGSAGQ